MAQKWIHLKSDFETFALYLSIILFGGIEDYHVLSVPY